jgi:hypothetical protein
MEILEAYDLTGPFRQAALLVGCDHKMVAHWVAVRELRRAVRRRHERRIGGRWRTRCRRRSRSQSLARGADPGRSGALEAGRMGYEGSERMVAGRAVAEPKRRWRQQHGRRTRPWIPEPGLWLRWDHGEGPVIAGARMVFFCAWLAWSRYGVIVPLRDKTLPSVVIALDRTLRRFDGVPTYALTDDEKTATIEHGAGSRSATRRSSRSLATMG